ncbi:hypothetical protein [Methylosinus sp. Ce-a6]|uniref:hypothetical protein n=1 Tax=Methylosinus sp. Ce-a6 TaxID=2172005 RepID=UPI0013588A71|nr:hypothetical protein [Methylosinus sp. Ce-a6]
MLETFRRNSSVSVRPGADTKNGTIFENDSNADAAFDFGLRVIDFEGPISFDQAHGVFDGHLFAVFAVEYEFRQMREMVALPNISAVTSTCVLAIFVSPGVGLPN